MLIFIHHTWYIVGLKMCLSCTVMTYSASSIGVTLKCGLWAVQGHLKMAPIDRSYTTYYWSAIVSIALPCTIFQLSDVEYKYCNLEIYATGHTRSLEMASFDRSHSCSVVGVSCIVFEIKRHIGPKHEFFIPSFVIIELLKAKCLPALYYGLEACPVSKSLIRSLE